MMVHPIGMMRAATGGGGAPDFRAGYTYNRTYATTHNIPMPTGTVEGDLVIVVIAGHTGGLGSFSVTPPGWLTEIVSQEIATSSDWTKQYIGNAPSGAPAASFTFGADITLTGMTLSYDGGNYGAVGTTNSASVPVTSFTTTGITVAAGSKVAALITCGNNQASITSSPTLTYYGLPATHFQAKTFGFTDLPAQSAGTSDTVAFTTSSTRVVATMIEITA